MISLPWFDSRYLLSLYLGTRSATAVLVTSGSKKSIPLKYQQIDYASEIKLDDLSNSLQPGLNHLLDAFSDEMARDSIPVQVALADTLVNSAIFELDQIPSDQATRDKLLSLRFEKDLHQNMEQAAINSQVIQYRNKPALYAITVSERLVNLLQSVFQQRQQNLVCTDKAVHYLFNHYCSQLIPSSALLFVNNEYWTLLIWDADKNVAYIRSKTHTENASSATIAQDVMRLLHTYQQSNDKVNRLYLLSTDAYESSLHHLLQQQAGMELELLRQQSENPSLQIPINDASLFALEQR